MGSANTNRLYDERIAAINNDLSQLSGPHPTHPELLRQVQVVQQSRDEKFDIEQRLLVFKIGTLKRKSIAERSQIHSAYFQTIRDVRERHLEKASEFFYRIQRDRFKTDESVPSYSIPFPTRRSQQITQQMSYNKEVSILSGVAKYVGFPAAPEIVQARPGELDDDMEKMGVCCSFHLEAKKGSLTLYLRLLRTLSGTRDLFNRPYLDLAFLLLCLNQLRKSNSSNRRHGRTPNIQHIISISTAPNTLPQVSREGKSRLLLQQVRSRSSN